MAGGDYRSCDVCGCKTYYDADLQYDFGTYPRWGLRLGDWKVICIECAKTHECVIVPRAAVQPSGPPTIKARIHKDDWLIVDASELAQIADILITGRGVIEGTADQPSATVSAVKDPNS